MNLKPVLSQVLVELLPVEVTSSGGIVLNSENETKREKTGRDIGYLRALSPLAFAGIAGCDADTAEGRALQAGMKIGDKVEFKRYDGKVPTVAEFHKEWEMYRVLTDTNILLVVEE